MNIIQKFISRLLPNEDEGLLRKIPLSVPGELYVSPMPYGAYDPGNQVLKIYLRNKVDHVFVLVTDAELARKSRRDLLKKYGTFGLDYSRFVLKDWMAPSMGVVHEMVATAEKMLREKHRRIAVHCHAGVGRTAIAVCCIAMRIEGWSAETAMANIAQFMTINITDEQRRFIKRYEETEWETIS